MPGVPPLFQVLPRDLFMPLAARNRQHYWQLLVLLYTRFFGPEADLPPATGWDRREFTATIERLLDEDDPWEPEEGEDPQDSPPQVRSNGYFNRLVAAGWFREEKIGLARVISMPDAVCRFMAELLEFIDFTPPAVGAKMRSIESALDRVLTSQQPGADLDEAAAQAKVLVTAMGSMSLRIRDLQRGLGAQVPTAEAVRQIFSEYIGKVYMADYAQLAGPDHPLARKGAVMARVHDIEYTHHRERLIQWYVEHDKRTAGDTDQAEALLERTLRRIKALNRLQDFLDRLEEDVNRMNRRMLALIDYRLHAPSHLGKRIRRAVAGVKCAAESDLGMPVSPGQMLTSELLARPRARKALIPRTADRTRELTPLQEARRRLHNQAKAARRITPAELQAYLKCAMGSRVQMRASELPITSIKELRAVQTLSSLALKATTQTHRHGGRGTVGSLPRYSFLAAPTDEPIRSGYLEMPDFIITKGA